MWQVLADILDTSADLEMMAWPFRYQLSLGHLSPPLSSPGFGVDDSPDVDDPVPDVLPVTAASSGRPPLPVSSPTPVPSGQRGHGFARSLSATALQMSAGAPANGDNAAAGATAAAGPRPAAAAPLPPSVVNTVRHLPRQFIDEFQKEIELDAAELIVESYLAEFEVGSLPR